MSNAVIVEKLQNTFVIRFNRPEIRNPLSILVLEELLDIIVEISADEEIWAVIFTGTAGVFASGADLREIAEVSSQEAKEFALRGQNLTDRIAGLNQITIAAINGFCFGGALDLALACDRRIATPGASFSHPGVNLGIITGWGGTQRLPRLVGEAMAFEMFLEAKHVTAGDALRIGLIDSISDDPLAAARAYSRSI